MVTSRSVQAMGRPSPHAPQVLLLTGPAASGKTTVADRWARRHADGPAVHISLDDVRDWVKSGYANPEDGWCEAAERQYALARRVVASAVREYAAAGYVCVIDDAVFPDWPEVSVDGWQRELGDLSLCLVALMPSPDVLAERNTSRSGHRRLTPETLKIIHGQMEGWRPRGVPIIDNTDLSVDETVAPWTRSWPRHIGDGPEPHSASPRPRSLTPRSRHATVRKRASPAPGSFHPPPCGEPVQRSRPIPRGSTRTQSPGTCSGGRACPPGEG